LQLDRDLALDDHEQSLTLFTRLQEHGARGHRRDRRQRRQMPQTDLVEVGEHVDRLERFRLGEIDVRHGVRG
jgi:hypothetical protein